MKDMAAFFTLVCWIAGVVLAKGFWPTTISIVFPPYAMYLFIERVMKMTGVS